MDDKELPPGTYVGRFIDNDGERTRYAVDYDGKEHILSFPPPTMQDVEAALTAEFANPKLDVDAITALQTLQHSLLSGVQRLSQWFGLSYASWLTWPRVLMEDMPDDWQRRMAVLAEEFDKAYPSWIPDDGRFYVQMRKKRRWHALPSWLGNYRRPDADAIEQAKRPWWTA
jgi:hypothetical protein